VEAVLVQNSQHCRRQLGHSRYAQQLSIAIASSLLIMHTDKLVVIDDDELDSTNDKDEDEDEAEATCSSVDLSSAKQDANPYSALLT
jgi:hypothetical protein